MIFNNILEAMGNTPMIQLQRMVDEDSIIIFKHPSKIYIEKEIVGKERNHIDIFL